MKAPHMIAAVLASAFATAAHASAWTQPQGTGQIIVTGIHSESSRGYDRDGNVIDIPDYTKSEVYALIEYGVTDDLTLILTPSFSHVGVEGAENSTGLGYTELGARYRLGTSGGWVFSAQATVRIPGKKREDAIAQIGSTDAEIDLRALVGTGFQLGGANAFVDLQGGYRIRNGDPPDEYHLDATFGIRPTPRLLLLAQSFNTISNGAGRGIFDRYRYHNLYLSAGYDVTPNWTVQLGGLMTLGGENALRERGLLMGIWHRF